MNRLMHEENNSLSHSISGPFFWLQLKASASPCSQLGLALDPGQDWSLSTITQSLAEVFEQIQLYRQVTVGYKVKNAKQMILRPKFMFGSTPSNQLDLFHCHKAELTVDLFLHFYHKSYLEINFAHFLHWFLTNQITRRIMQFYLKMMHTLKCMHRLICNSN